MKLLRRILTPMLMAMFAILAITTLSNTQAMAASWQSINPHGQKVQNPVRWRTIKIGQNVMERPREVQGGASVATISGPISNPSDHISPSHYCIKPNPNNPGHLHELKLETYVRPGSAILVESGDNSIHPIKIKLTISNIVTVPGGWPLEGYGCVQPGEYGIKLETDWFSGVSVLGASKFNYSLEFFDDTTGQPLDFTGSWVSFGSLNPIPQYNANGTLVADGHNISGEGVYLDNCSVIEVSQAGVTLLRQYDSCGAEGMGNVPGAYGAEQENCDDISAGTGQYGERFSDCLNSLKYVNAMASFKIPRSGALTFTIKSSWDNTVGERHIPGVWAAPVLAPISETYIDEPEKWIIKSDGSKVKTDTKAVGEEENFQIDWYMPYMGASTLTTYENLVFTDTLNEIFDLNGSCENAVSMKITGKTEPLNQGTDYTLSCNGQTVTARMTGSFLRNNNNYKGQTLSLFINTKVNNKILNSSASTAYENRGTVSGINTPPTKTQPKPPHLVPSKTVAPAKALVGDNISYNLKVINQKVNENTGNTGGKTITITDEVDGTILENIQATSSDATCTATPNTTTNKTTIKCTSTKTLQPITPGSAQDTAANSINIRITAKAKKAKKNHLNEVSVYGDGDSFNCTQSNYSAKAECKASVTHDIVEIVPYKTVSDLVVPKGGKFTYTLDYDVPGISLGYDSLTVYDVLPDKVKFVGGVKISLGGQALNPEDYTFIMTSGLDSEGNPAAKDFNIKFSDEVARSIKDDQQLAISLIAQATEKVNVGEELINQTYATANNYRTKTVTAQNTVVDTPVVKHADRYIAYPGKEVTYDAEFPIPGLQNGYDSISLVDTLPDHVSLIEGTVVVLIGNKEVPASDLTISKVADGRSFSVKVTGESAKVTEDSDIMLVFQGLVAKDAPDRVELINTVEAFINDTSIGKDTAPVIVKHRHNPIKRALDSVEGKEVQEILLGSRAWYSLETDEQMVASLSPAKEWRLVDDFNEEFDQATGKYKVVASMDLGDKIKKGDDITKMFNVFYKDQAGNVVAAAKASSVEFEANNDLLNLMNNLVDPSNDANNINNDDTNNDNNSNNTNDNNDADATPTKTVSFKWTAYFEFRRSKPAEKVTNNFTEIYNGDKLNSNEVTTRTPVPEPPAAGDILARSIVSILAIGTLLALAYHSLLGGRVMSNRVVKQKRS